MLKSTYEKLYAQKKTTAAKIAAQFHNNWQVVTDNYMGAPQSINRALCARLKNEKEFLLTVHTLLDVGDCPFYAPDLKKQVGVSWFSGNGARRAVAEGLCDVMPCHYSEMAEIFKNQIDIDALLLMVSPMNEQGEFSTGIIGSNCPTLIKKAKHIYVEVNPNMPRVSCAPSVSVADVTALCESKEPLLEAPEIPFDPVSKKIGEIIAAEIKDGSTLQLGIGAIPNAVGEALKTKRCLGLHTELLTDKMLELIECGAVNNQVKEIDHRCTVATFAFGSKKLYKYLDNNLEVEIRPATYVNNPEVIGRFHRFCSINSALQVDFWGQVCAESLGTYHVSGTGGQVDFVRGAHRSHGGRSYIALPSTAQKGTVSRIVPVLDLGAVVTTTKNDVDSIVTEYGIAQLRGKTLRQRTKALIAIAHPKFRDELTKSAQERKIL